MTTSPPAPGQPFPGAQPPGPHIPPPGPPPWRPRWWQRHGVKAGALIGLLGVCGLVILALVRQQTGTEGFLVGLGLAVLPAPVVVMVLRLLGRVRPAPWKGHAFAFAWGACAAALVAIVANSFATEWIATTTADPSDADALGATVVAPIVEESVKAAALLLVLLFRRRQLVSVMDAVVLAGITAAGFAFTENILYLGNAFGTDRIQGEGGFASVTLATFFVRAVMSPFAHPLFTSLSGLGFGLAALAPERARARRVLLRLSGLLLAMALHATWNLSAVFGTWGFPLVYGAVMMPAAGLLTWFVLWHRQRDLRTVREELPRYALAGWFSPFEPLALGSMRSRRIAAEYGAYHGERADARTLRRYAADATTLALLRRREEKGGAGPDFAAWERRLLDGLWARREQARPAFAYTWHIAPPRPRRDLPVQPGWAAPPAYGWGQGKPPLIPAPRQAAPVPGYGTPVPGYGTPVPGYGAPWPYGNQGPPPL